MKDRFRKHFENEPDTDPFDSETELEIKKETNVNHIVLSHHSTNIEMHSLDLNTLQLKTEALSLFFILTDEEFGNAVKKHFLKEFLERLEKHKEVKNE